jgi:XTP/dITP diphosphohydrolase
MQKLTFASNNQHKIKELKQILFNSPYNIIPQSDFNVSEQAETGLTFVENAILKARNACRHTKLPAIADDSGLEVNALKGEPGIYSARYAGEKASDTDNNSKLLFQLKNIPNESRSAKFQCLIVFLRHELDPTPIICQGTWHGSIAHEPRGENGFGYDPIFYVPTHDCSAAELPPEIKNQISHRAQALRILANSL